MFSIKSRKKIRFLEKPNVPVCQTGQSGFQLMCSVTVYSIGPSPAKPDIPIFETGGFGISRITDELSDTIVADLDDWRTPLVHYLENPVHITDRKVRR
jgi:hypothetical protein